MHFAITEKKPTSCICRNGILSLLKNLILQIPAKTWPPKILILGTTSISTASQSCLVTAAFRSRAWTLTLLIQFERCKAFPVRFWGLSTPLIPHRIKTTSKTQSWKLFLPCCPQSLCLHFIRRVRILVKGKERNCLSRVASYIHSWRDVVEHLGALRDQCLPWSVAASCLLPKATAFTILPSTWGFHVLVSVLQACSAWTSPRNKSR